MPFRKYSGGGPVVSRLMLSVLSSNQFGKTGSVSAYLGLIPRIRKSGALKQEKWYLALQKKREEKHQAPLSTKEKVERNI